MALWECVLEKTVCNRAERAGYFQRKVSWVQRDGAPDRVFIKDGRTVWIEFKVRGGVARPGQLREHAKMRAAGAEVHVVDNEEDAARLLPGYVIG